MKLEKKIIDTLLEEMAGFGFISGHAEVIAEEEPHSARQAAIEHGEIEPDAADDELENVAIISIYCPGMRSWRMTDIQRFGTAVANNDALTPYAWRMESITAADASLLDGYGCEAEPGGLLYTIGARTAADLQICISDRISCASGKACGSPAMYRVFCEAMEQARKAWIEAGRPAGWALPAEADTGIGRLLIKECPPQYGASTPHVLFICERDEVTDDNSLGRLLMTGIKSDRVNMSEWSPARLEAAY